MADYTLDRINVIETIYCEMRAIDAKDWPALRECFSDEIELDMTGRAVWSQQAD